MHPAWDTEPLWIDGCTHRNLHVYTPVVTVDFHGLGNQQDGNRDQTEATQR